MSTQLEITPEVERRLREIVRDEFGRLPGRSTHHGLPQSEMRAVMARITELRKRIAISEEAWDEIIREHRKEFHRGPLVDEPEETDAS